MTVAGLRNSCRRLMSGAHRSSSCPLAGIRPGRSRRQLIQRVMRWGELRAVVVELLVAVVVEPMFRWLVTGEHGMAGRFSVGGGVLGRRVVATADVAALGAPAQMKPPPALLFALHTARAAGRDSGVDAVVFSHRFHEIRPWVPAQRCSGNRRSGNAARAYSQRMSSDDAEAERAPAETRDSHEAFPRLTTDQLEVLQARGAAPNRRGR
jgi:hypothetical protein